MKLQGQHGYAMVALIVGMSIMAIMMTVALPTWRQMAQREKEAELIFRGQQYARAIGLFQKKSGPGVLPPSIDALVDGHYLRKKYKDPITGGDFEVLQAGATAGTPGAGTVNASTPGAGTLGAGTLNANTPGVGTLGPSIATPQSQPGAGGRSSGSAQSGSGQSAPMGRGGVMGVASRSKDASICIYNGRTHYN